MSDTTNAEAGFLKAKRRKPVASQEEALKAFLQDYERNARPAAQWARQKYPYTFGYEGRTTPLPGARIPGFGKVAPDDPNALLKALMGGGAPPEAAAVEKQLVAQMLGGDVGGAVNPVSQWIADRAGVSATGKPKGLVGRMVKVQRNTVPELSVEDAMKALGEKGLDPEAAATAIERNAGDLAGLEGTVSRLRPSALGAGLASLGYGAFVAPKVEEALKDAPGGSAISDIGNEAAAWGLGGAAGGPWGAAIGAGIGAGLGGLKHFWGIDPVGWAMSPLTDMLKPDEKPDATNQLLDAVGQYQKLGQVLGDPMGVEQLAAAAQQYNTLINSNVDPKLAAKVFATGLGTIQTHMAGGFTDQEQRDMADREFAQMQQLAADRMAPLTQASQATQDALTKQYGDYVASAPANLQGILKANQLQLGLLGNLAVQANANPYGALMKEYAPYLRSRFLNAANASALAQENAAQSQLQQTASGTGGASGLSDLLQSGVLPGGDPGGTPGGVPGQDILSQYGLG